jgi:hypothetical protein
MPRAQFQAKSTAEALHTLDGFLPVHPGDLWFVPIEERFDPTRFGVGRRLERLLHVPGVDVGYAHLAVVGHLGTGKSTQVRAAMTRLADHGVFTVYVDALQCLDTSEFTFSDLLLVFCQRILDALLGAGASFPSQEAKLLRDWFAEVVLTEAHRTEILGSVETAAEGGVKIPFLAKLSAKITALVRNDNEYRREIRRRVERDPPELLRRVNQLLDAAAAALPKLAGKPRKVAVVVDNLEKIPRPEVIDAVVLRRAEELRQLRCHLLLFFHPATQYAPVGIQLEQTFRVIEVPALPIRESSDPVDVLKADALRVARELLDRRVDVESVFESPEECVRRILLYSGGRLRDFFTVGYAACEFAIGRKLNPPDVERAARALTGHRSPLVRPEDWPRLAEVHRDKRLSDWRNQASLILNGLVVNYDGEPWWDVHPVIRLDPRFEQAWKALQVIRPSSP